MQKASSQPISEFCPATVSIPGLGLAFTGLASTGGCNKKVNCLSMRVPGAFFGKPTATNAHEDSSQK
jgi:hypothetical protein